MRKSIRDASSKKTLLTEKNLLEFHSELMRGVVTGRLRGHYRQAQCVISDSKNRSIVYMAPEWRDVAPLMKQLLIWYRRKTAEEISPLVLAAQFHFEFVTIHPFMDGNGRLARLLSNGILMAGGYDVGRYAALEKQHELNRAGYYQALASLQNKNFYDIPTDQSISSWIVYWLKCLLATFDEALVRTSLTREPEDSSLYASLADRLQKAESLFKRHLKLKAADYAELVNLSRTQAVEDLNHLVKAKIIERIGGGRSTFYRLRKKL